MSKFPLVLNIATWFGVCTLFNISSKNLSHVTFHGDHFWNPFLTTIAQLSFTSLLGGLYLVSCNKQQISPSHLLLPLKSCLFSGVALAMANLSMHWALSRTSVGMFQTAKSAGPLFTAFTCHVFLGRRYSKITYLTLIPIVVGLAFASVTNLEFELFGILACLFSAFCQVFVNLDLKRILEMNFVLDPDSPKRALHAYELQLLVSFSGFCVLLLMGLVVAVFFSFPGQASLFDGKWFYPQNPFSFALFVNVFLYACESILAYSVNSQLPRLTYSVVDAIRRLNIVICTDLFFHLPEMMTGSRTLNLFGVLSVFLGAIAFAHVGGIEK